MVRKILLICGVLSSLLYTAMNIFVPMLYEGYNAVSQTVSELTAIGAPTKTLWGWLGTLYTLLVIAFGWAVWKSAAPNRYLRITGGLIFIYGLVSIIVWPFAPMHQREVLAAGAGTFSDILHMIMGILTALFYIVIIGLGAAAFGKRFRFYSIATIIIILLFGALMGLDVPAMQANLPTPWLGVWERIMIGIFLLWVIVLAITLLRRETSAGLVNRNRNINHHSSLAAINQTR